ncbi:MULTISPECIES: hypothetical protein [Bacillus]|uniref:hypothetical protein n=1 Tax=Bacillus TaxID=1386 RepID=UPI0003E2AE8D|nr:hypothetical protein [Bacillus cereus]ETT88875.1 hypothetical protein C175_00180 [Bacillus cereus]OOR38523.1 hypothetical protein BW895_21505 [Bacillus cereus]
MDEQTVDYKITIRGRCSTENQNEIDKLYYMIIGYAHEHRETGVINIKKDAGEPSITEAEGKGNLKTIPININLDEKNIKLIAEMVHQGIIQRLEKENRYKTYVMHSL